MKKLIIAASIALLAACSAPAPKAPQVNFMPLATTSQTEIVDNVLISLKSKDVRSAQYVAIIDSGRTNIQPLHAQQNVRIALETAFIQQLRTQGYQLSVNSDNSVMFEIQELLVNVSQSMMSSDMTASVRIQVTAENLDGKLVKTFKGSANNSSTFSSSTAEIEQMVNHVTNLVLADIANDTELRNYMKERF
jgi:uncharacterized lipoprotein